MNAIIFDCETAHPIYSEWDAKRHPKIEKWARDWRDFENMGISVITAYAFDANEYWIFEQDNPLYPGFDRFQELVNLYSNIISFNGRYFDDLLCAANGIQVKTTYDLCVATRRAAGLPDTWEESEKPKGWSYKLDHMAHINLGYGKMLSGKDAPFDWFYGRKAQVRCYCMHDVKLTKELFERRHQLIDPNTGRWLNLPDLDAFAKRDVEQAQQGDRP